MNVIYSRRRSCAGYICLFLSLFIFSAYCDLRFYINSPDDGYNTHNMLGAWFGPENYDVIGLLIFLEPDQDCKNVKPHSMYNDTIDYSTIGDFILYLDIVCKF